MVSPAVVEWIIDLMQYHAFFKIDKCILMHFIAYEFDLPQTNAAIYSVPRTK